MDTTLDSAPSETFSIPKAGAFPAFLGLTFLFTIADAGPRGIAATAALAALKAVLFLYFFPEH